MVLVDTSIWSLALRRSSSDLNEAQRRPVQRWSELVREGHAALIGPIRQETLSGIRDQAAFETLRAHLAAFDDMPIRVGDYEEAARLFNVCRARGVTGTPIDLLICAVAQRMRLPIFTHDKDFERYARHLSIKLLRIEG